MKNNSARHGFRLIMMPEDVNALYLATNMMNNNRLGATLVYDNEVYYDVGVRLKGSMWTRNNAAGTGYDVDFNADQRFRGIHDSTAIKVRDPKELLVKFLAVQGGVPGTYDDLISIVTPGGQGNGVAKLTTGYDNEYLDSVFEDGGDGTVYKMEGIRVTQRPSRRGPEDLKTYFPNIGWVSNFDLADLGNDKEQYRWPISISDNRDQDDFTELMAMARRCRSRVRRGPSSRTDDGRGRVDADLCAHVAGRHWRRLYARESAQHRLLCPA